MNLSSNSALPFTADPAVFLKNCALFTARFPQLSAMLGLDRPEAASAQWKALPPEYRLIQTKAGGSASQPSLLMENNCFHSKYRPKEEASRLLSSDFFKQQAAQRRCIFAGLGLGYLAVQYQERYPAAEIVIIEPDRSVFLCFLAAEIHEQLWRHEKLSVLVGTAAEEAASFLNDTGWSERTLFKQTVSLEAQKQWFDSFFAALNRNREKNSINAKTLERFGSLWLNNTVKNLDMVCKTAKIGCFRNAFSGCPAVVLAGGPSLTRHLYCINKNDKNHLIIAVDTAVRACAQAGIVPDFILSFDPQYWNYLHTAGQDTSSSILIGEAAVFPAVLRQSYRAVFLSHSSVPFARYLEQEDTADCLLAAGGSVATTAWDFARYIGANPIIMAGLDLAFPHRQTHFTGSTFEEAAHTCSARLSPAEAAHYRALYSAFPQPHKNYAGGTVLTDRRMLLYAWWFERTLPKYPELKTYNLMPEGVFIPGMPPCSEEEFTAFCNGLSRSAIQDRLHAIIGSAYSEAFYTATSIRRKQLADSVRKTAESAQFLSQQAEQAELLCRRLAQCNNQSQRKALTAQLSKTDKAIRSGFAKELVEVLFFDSGYADVSDEPDAEVTAEQAYCRIGKMARQVAEALRNSEFFRKS